MKDKIRNAWKSMTIWFNGVLASGIAVYDQVKDQIPQLQQYLTPETFKYIAVTAVLVNIALRFKTTKDLAHK